MCSSSIVMFGWLATAASSARWISRPVTSSQCTTRWRVCAPSRPRSSSPPASRASRTPRSSRRWTCAGPSLHAQLDDLAIAQAVAGDQRVLDVLLEAVVGREHRGDAALGPVGVGVGRPLLRDHDDAAVLGGEEREVEPGDSRSDDEVVGLERLGHVSGRPYSVCDLAGSSRYDFVVRARLAVMLVVGLSLRPARRRRATSTRGPTRTASSTSRTSSRAAAQWKKVLTSEPRPRHEGRPRSAALPALRQGARRPTARPSASTATIRSSTRPSQLYRIPVAADPRGDQGRERLRPEGRVVDGLQGPDAGPPRASRSTWARRATSSIRARTS